MCVLLFSCGIVFISIFNVCGLLGIVVRFTMPFPAVLYFVISFSLLPLLFCGPLEFCGLLEIRFLIPIVSTLSFLLSNVGDLADLVSVENFTGSIAICRCFCFSSNLLP